MFEALLLAAMTTGPEPVAEQRAARRPSLELLEFLGEFGDDEDGVFDDAGDMPPAKPPPPPASKRPNPKNPATAAPPARPPTDHEAQP